MRADSVDSAGRVDDPVPDEVEWAFSRERVPLLAGQLVLAFEDEPVQLSLPIVL